MNRKIEQMSAVIERGVREVISRGFHDPRIAGLITVTGVKVTADLAQAIIRISVLPAEKEVLTLHGLQAAARFIRREVGDIVAARKLPEFIFQGDSSLKKEAAILGDLAKVRDELAAKGIVVEHVNPTAPGTPGPDAPDQPDTAEPSRTTPEVDGSPKPANDGGASGWGRKGTDGWPRSAGGAKEDQSS
jgi:ribosome-binding factor A